MPSIPRHNGSLPGKPPIPISVVVTGRERRRASSWSSAEALERITPPPAYTTGRSEARISSRALSTCFGCPS